MSERGREAMEKAKGLAKEAAGSVAGNEEMKTEGRAQREGGAGEEKEIRSIIRESVKRSRREA